MAFYNHTHFTDYDSYDSTAYDDHFYNSEKTELSISQSSYEPSFHNLFDYPPIFSQPQMINSYDSDNYGAYDSAISFSANACSASTFSVPKVIEYDPGYWCQSYQNQEGVSTQFVVSYSVSEFNEADFEEYDPTPYDGGYDISQTYGKPLPPSNEICYPPSSSSSSAAAAPPPPPPKVQSLNDPSSKGSIEKAPKERIDEKKPTQVHEDNEDSSGIGESNGGFGQDLGSGYDYGRAVNQIPSGYGLEAMDLCETLFGYWPCLSRIKRQTDCRQGQGHRCEEWHGNQWQTAADYLFGSYDPCPYGRSQGQGEIVYGYERHYQEGALHGKIGYAEDCLLNKFS